MMEEMVEEMAPLLGPRPLHRLGLSMTPRIVARAVRPDRLLLEVEVSHLRQTIFPRRRPLDCMKAISGGKNGQPAPLSYQLLNRISGDHQ